MSQDLVTVQIEEGSVLRPILELRKWYRAVGVGWKDDELGRLFYVIEVSKNGFMGNWRDPSDRDPRAMFFKEAAVDFKRVMQTPEVGAWYRAVGTRWYHPLIRGKRAKIISVQMDPAHYHRLSEPDPWSFKVRWEDDIQVHMLLDCAIDDFEGPVPGPE